MRDLRCNREDELLDALGRGFVDSDLRSHLDGCAACAELELVAGALLDDRAAAVVSAPVPTASAMWVRMQVRARLEAEAKARRALVIGQTLSVTFAVVLIAAVVGDDLIATVPTMVMAAGTTAMILGATAIGIVVSWGAHLVLAHG